MCQLLCLKCYAGFKPIPEMNENQLKKEENGYPAGKDTVVCDAEDDLLPETLASN